MANGVIEDVGGEIGYTATSTLVLWYGGASLHVPVEAREDHLLAKLIGMPAYRRLVAAFGGESVWIPKPISDSDARARRVARMLLAGRSEREIADEIGVTVRRVHQLRVRLAADGILDACETAAK